MNWRYPDQPAPAETHELFNRGEIGLSDYLWLTDTTYDDYLEAQEARD